MRHEANKLINESSPYLLQHAYNPVQWYPWGEEALSLARREDKVILVSIGYSACHWCHVMERESFENEAIAQVMNENLICIKIDREERPDIDQVYMDAVQYMGLHGGWPLNVFLTPDAKPFYGGTYFPPDKWQHIVGEVARAYKNNKAEVISSAEKFTESLNRSEVVKYKLTTEETPFTNERLDGIFEKLSTQFDTERGGMMRTANKFPMPSIYIFLLRYYALTNNVNALKHINNTLNAMAYGGIYDHLGGGFARYSVDTEWFAPHFEKMLYDNAQLISLYAEAFTVSADKLYKGVVYETVSFVKREMQSMDGGFYSALDADSEGEEGKFYVWEAAELEEILGTDAAIFMEYYNVTPEGNWEHGRNILHRRLSDSVFSQLHGISKADLFTHIASCRKILLEARCKRVKPGLDDKIIASWNGLMLKGLVDAYRAFDEPLMLKMALDNATFLRDKMLDGSRLFHSYKNANATIDGFLEDYAAVIQGYTALYQATFDEEWLLLAQKLCEYTLAHFYDESENLFFFTARNAERLIADKKEIFDNVIPSSNSMMARNLHELGMLLERSDYLEKAQTMLSRVAKMLDTDVQYVSNWGSLYTSFVTPTVEVVVVGKNAQRFRRGLDKIYYPNKVTAGTTQESELPLLTGRTPSDDKTLIYVCRNKTCLRPCETVSEALKQIMAVN